MFEVVRDYKALVCMICGVRGDGFCGVRGGGCPHADYLGPQRRQIVEDFESGRHALMSHVVLMTSSWQVLTRLLCGLGHFSEEVARECYRKARRQWTLLTQAQRGAAHPLSQRLLGPGQLREEGDEFMLGIGLAGLPTLHLEASRLCFVHVEERSNERKHALANREIDRSGHTHAPTLSLVARLPELHSRLERDPTYITQLASDAYDLYNPFHSSHVCGTLRFELQLVFHSYA